MLVLLTCLFILAYFTNNIRSVIPAKSHAADAVNMPQTIEGTLIENYTYDQKGEYGEKLIYSLKTGSETLQIIDSAGKLNSVRNGARLRLSGIKSNDIFNLDSQTNSLEVLSLPPTPTQIISEHNQQLAVQVTATPTPITKKVLVLDFDPYITGTTPVSVYYGWSNPLILQSQYVTQVKSASHNYVNYKIINTQIIRDYPVKQSGFKFTNAQFKRCIIDSSPSYCWDIIDYAKLITDYNLCSQVTSGAIDEVWLWGGPYFGYWEWEYGGPDSPSFIPTIDGSCSKRFPIMGFSYERDVNEMLHDLGHRSESIMTNIYGYYPYDPDINLNNAWSRFTIYDKELPGQASCGNIHFPPNAMAAYDYSNKRTVNSACNSWLNYPASTSVKLPVNCNDWDCNSFEKYWLTHLPHTSGSTNNNLNNWWAYIIDYGNVVQVSSVPVLSSPANGSLQTLIRPVLIWDPSTLDSVSYQLEVAKDANFVNLVFPRATITIHTTYTIPVDLLSSTTYYWRVRSVNDQGIVSTWSTVWNFNESISAPTNLTIDPQSIKTLRPIFSWSPSVNGTGYTLQLFLNDAYTGNAAYTGTTATNYFTPAANINIIGNKAEVYWRVRATNGTSIYSPSAWTTGTPFKGPKTPK